VVLIPMKNVSSALSRHKHASGRAIAHAELFVCAPANLILKLSVSNERRRATALAIYTNTKSVKSPTI
jgi:hypothetical protein